MYFAPHTHTTYSDGMKTPLQALQEAIKLGFSKYAITDHETIDALSDSELEGFMELTGKKTIELIPGVELSTIGGVPDSRGADIELVGLCFDPHAEPILNVCGQNQEIRREWKEKVYKLVNRFFDFDPDERLDDYFLSFTNSGNVANTGKPHFVNALLSHPKVLAWLNEKENLNEFIREKIARQRELSMNIDPALIENIRQEVYEDYLFSMLRSPDEKSFDLVTDENSGAFYEPKEYVHMRGAISAVRESGGLVVIPHAFVSAKRIGMNVEEFLELFGEEIRENNVVGIETDYPILPKYRKYYQKYGKGRIVEEPRTGRRDSDEYPTIDKDMTFKEMQHYANEDMHLRVRELEKKLGIPVNSLIRMKVSDCHFKPGEHLLRFCSNQAEYEQLMEAKRKFT